jgi:SdrD B-like domain/Putative Ig domain
MGFGSIGDFVWNDTNHNGIQDAGEAGKAGVTVNLLDGFGNWQASTATDGTGHYRFSGLAAGNYRVRFILPAGYQFSPQHQGGDPTLDSDPDASGTTDVFNLATNQSRTDIDAGLSSNSSGGTGTIGDFVWNDTNHNGIQDTGEGGISGVAVNLLDSLGNWQASTTTDMFGHYAFTGLPAGDHKVWFGLPAGYQFSPVHQGSDPTLDSDANSTGQTDVFSLAAGQTRSDIDAGLFSNSGGGSNGSIGDFVWQDTNQNGIQDAGEPGVVGVSVILLDSLGNAQGFTSTDFSGHYGFGEVPAGSYRLQFNAPAGYQFSPQHQGGDPTLDSDPDASGLTDVVSLSAGQARTDIDAGLIQANSGGGGNGYTIHVVEGQAQYGQTVATFTPPANDWGPFSYLIEWGDGASESGNLGGGAYTYTLTNDHLYQHAGTYPITVHISDPTGNEWIIHSTADVLDAPLRWENPTTPLGALNATSLQLLGPSTETSAEGDQVVVQVSVHDYYNAPVTSYGAIGLPPGLSINSQTGLISGTVDYAAAENLGGRYPATLFATDSIGGYATAPLSWTVTDTNRPPQLTNPGSQQNVQGDDVSLTIRGTDPDGNVPTYGAAGLPPGLGIDEFTGEVSGTLAATPQGSSTYEVTVSVSDGTLGASQTFPWTVSTVNHRPTFDTLPPQAPVANQSNLPGDSVSLPISASDADQDPLTFFATGLPAGLSIDPDQGRISGLILPSAASDSPHPVTVTVSDGKSSTSESFTWLVKYVGVTSPDDQAGVAGDAVSLPITAVAATGAPLSYTATGLPPGLAIGAATGVISGQIISTAAAGSPYTVTVTASDGSHSDSTSFVWAVAPVAVLNPGDQDGTEGDRVSLPISARAPQGENVTFSAAGLPPGLAIDPNNGVITGTISPTAQANSPYSVTVAASAAGQSASQTFTWGVAPHLVVVAPATPSNAVGDQVTLQVRVSGAGSNVTFSASGLPDGLSLNASTGLISGTIAPTVESASPYLVTVSATDGTFSNSAAFLWRVSHLLVVSPGNQDNTVGDAVSLSIAVHHADSDPLTFRASGLPAGLTIHAATGLIDGTIAQTADGDSPYTVTVTAADASHTASATFIWGVTQPVQVTPPSDQQNTGGDVVTLPILANSTTEATLNYGAIGLPPGLSIDSSSGVIAGTIAATANANSPYSVTVMVSDGQHTASQTFSWTVLHLSIADPGEQDSVEGSVVSLPISAEDAAGGPLSYSAVGLPPGLDINPVNGNIQGIIAAGAAIPGTYPVAVTVSDGVASADVTFVWKVARVALDNPGSLTQAEGTAVDLPIVAHGFPYGPLTYTASNLPPGLSIDPSTGVITGTLVDGSVSQDPYVVSVAASDGSQAAKQTFSWEVTAPFALLSPGDQANAEGDWVSLPVETADAPWNVHTYSAAGLPAGLSLDSQSGLISGWIDYTAAESASGSYTVMVTAADDSGNSISQSFHWTVTDATFAARGLDLTPTVGEATDQTVAEFHVADQAAQPGDFAALIAWGDGTTSAGTVLAGTAPGTFTVVGTHAYGTVDVLPLQITISHPGGSSTLSGTAIVQPAALTASGTSLTPTEGAALTNAVLATFSDAGPLAPAGAYTATVDWGDGNNGSGAMIASGAGTFQVAGSHSYAQPGIYSVRVSITGPGGGSAVTTTTMIVQGPSVTATGQAVTATEGSDATLTVATFTSSDGAAFPADFDALIDWGDGSVAGIGSVNLANGVFSVAGEHSYAEAGTYSIRASITGRDGSTVQAGGRAVVADAPLSATPVAIEDAYFLSVGGTVAVFTDQDRSSQAADFRVGIDWGDNSGIDPRGTISGWGGVFSVTGSHRYAQSGSYTIRVTITDQDGSATTVTSRVQFMGQMFAGARAPCRGGSSMTTTMQRRQTSRRRSPGGMAAAAAERCSTWGPCRHGPPRRMSSGSSVFTPTQ